MPSIKSRLAALRVLMERKPDFDFDQPLEKLDPISQSIVETVRELEALDTTEKKEAYCREHDTTPKEIDGLVNLFRTGRYEVGEKSFHG